MTESLLGYLRGPDPEPPSPLSRAYLTTVQAHEYLKAVAPRPPTLQTLIAWARPAYLRGRPNADVPVPAGKFEGRNMWSRKELDAWAARRRKRYQREEARRARTARWRWLKRLWRGLVGGAATRTSR